MLLYTKDFFKGKADFWGNFFHNLFHRPSSKLICDQQFLGEAQSSTAAY
ncbi:MAG: hypothetical protein NMK33_01540 [Candidatus Cardinium sp.]|nr:hypothetical protein [Cardinium endosymbiont of Dermatophagoides farinae]UWW97226.1 MAG: hypothetical protein NMK33_01540 [Candidatus Cardinium sp.]